MAITPHCCYEALNLRQMAVFDPGGGATHSAAPWADSPASLPALLPAEVSENGRARVRMGLVATYVITHTHTGCLRVARDYDNLTYPRLLLKAIQTELLAFCYWNRQYYYWLLRQFFINQKISKLKGIISKSCVTSSTAMTQFFLLIGCIESNNIYVVKVTDIYLKITGSSLFLLQICSDG